jgi:hypothetical protein
LTATGCGITADSSGSDAIGVVGGSTLSATSLGTVSTTWDNSSNINNGGSISSGTTIVQGISTRCSPALPAVPSYNASECTADPIGSQQGGATYSVGPGSANSTTQGGNLVCYTSLNIGSNGDKVTLNPGIYVISGGALTFASGANSVSNLGGNGVFFYLTGSASLTIANGANVSLTAPSSGTYSGDLVVQAAADTQAISIAGGANTSFNGTIYAPSAAVTLSNGSSTTITADIVATSLTLTGGGTLSSAAGSSSMGTMNISVAKITQ